MSGPIKLHDFKGRLMTASQIAHAHALSLPTVMRRLARGMTGDDLVAAPYAHPRVAGEARKPSDRPMTAAEARRYLRRTMKSLDRASTRYLDSIRSRDRDSIEQRLKLAVDKAEMMVSYWRERVRMAEVHHLVAEPRIKGPWSPKPDDEGPELHTIDDRKEFDAAFYGKHGMTPDDHSKRVSSSNPTEDELADIFSGEE